MAPDERGPAAAHDRAMSAIAIHDRLQQPAVTEIATLRAELSGPQLG
jgi:hypothetical protein